jgi:hypothetical protein
LVWVLGLTILLVGCGAGSPPERTSSSTFAAEGMGSLELVTCDAILGWAQDSTAPSSSVAVELTFDTPLVEAADGAIQADLHRADLCATVGCEHGFEIAPPYSLFDDAQHHVFAYGNDVEEGSNVELTGSPLTMTCAPPPIGGIKRALPKASTLIEWRFDPFWHEAPTDDTTIQALPDGEPLPDKPFLVRADDGAPAVWLVEGDVRRSVPQPSGLMNWRFDEGSIETHPAADVYALVQGPALRARPMLVRTSADELFLVDDGEAGSPGPITPEPEPGPTPSGDDREAESQGPCAAQIVGARPGAGAWLLLVGLTVVLGLLRRGSRH